jgi:hypothetical protein
MVPQGCIYFFKIYLIKLLILLLLEIILEWVPAPTT